MVSRSFTSASKLPATESSELSRKPPVSPALTRLIMIGGKTVLCFSIASDSETPVSTSLRIDARIRASSLFSVCSARMFSVRSSDSPAEVMVAIWRLMMARSLSPTPLLMPGILISMLSPVPTGTSVDRDRRQSHRAQPAAIAALSDAASRRPLTSLPAALRPLYAKARLVDI